MLHDFITAHHDDVIRRCRVKHLRGAPDGDGAHDWMPRFLDHLVRALQAVPVPVALMAHRGEDPMHSEIGMAAALHGKAMQVQGYAVDDVVHVYAGVCQAILDLAMESGTPLLVSEFRILNRCLDNAIAHAVTEFSYQRDFMSADRHANDASERMELFLDELRNLLGTATLAFSAAKSGGLSASGATGAILERSLLGINHLIGSVSLKPSAAQSISDVLDVFPLAPFFDEVRTTAVPVAQALGCTLTVRAVDTTLALKGNRDLLYAALIGLLQNAFELTRPQTEVVLSACAAADRVLIEIADHSAGAGGARAMPNPGAGGSRDMLGIPVAQRFVAANDGELLVRDLPGTGYLVTVSLPRHAVPT